MRDSQNSGVSEFVLDDVLHYAIGFLVDVGGGLIHKENLGLTNYGSGDAYELSLAYTEVGAVDVDVVCQNIGLGWALFSDSEN